MLGTSVLFNYNVTTKINFLRTQKNTHTHTNIYIYIYIYIYVWLNNKDKFCLYNFIRILSSFQTSVLV